MSVVYTSVEYVLAAQREVKDLWFDYLILLLTYLIACGQDTEPKYCLCGAHVLHGLYCWSMCRCYCVRVNGWMWYTVV